jgi:hypothetical protein
MDTSVKNARNLNQTSLLVPIQQVAAPYPEGVAPTVVNSPIPLQNFVISGKLIAFTQSSLIG